MFADGSSDDRTALFFMPSFTPSPVPGQLGCELDESGAIVIDEDGRRAFPGCLPPGMRRPTRRRSCSRWQPGARRLLADGVRLFIQGGAVLLLALALGAQIATGFAGALLMLLIGTLEES